MFHADSPIFQTSLVLLLVVSVCAAPAAGLPETPHEDPNEEGTRIVLVDAAGENFVAQDDSTAYVWADSNVDVEVTYNLNGTANGTRVCLIPQGNSGTGACQPANQSDGFEHAMFTDVSPPTDGETTYRVTIVRDDSEEAAAKNQTTGMLASGELNITPIEPSGDHDNDGLTNEEEVKQNTIVYKTDSDNDGLQDGPEVNEYGTNPLTADTDGDGLRDAVEINQGTNPTKSDSDSDGLTDGEEMELGTDPTTSDSDGDGIPDGEEVEQETDPSAVDSDADGLNDNLENQINTDPTSMWSPLGWILLALIGVLALFVHRYVSVGRPGPIDPDESGAAAREAPTSRTQPPEPPRTDRERVLALLEENNGKLRQSKIVEETDWSKAKVSRLLARLDDNGDITKIRLGRENVICLPGREPEGSKPRTER